VFPSLELLTLDVDGRRAARLLRLVLDVARLALALRSRQNFAEHRLQKKEDVDIMTTPVTHPYQPMGVCFYTSITNIDVEPASTLTMSFYE